MKTHRRKRVSTTVELLGSLPKLVWIRGANLWRAYEDIWLSAPDEEKLSRSNYSLEYHEAATETNRKLLRRRWCIWSVAIVVLISGGFGLVAAIVGGVGLAVELYQGFQADEPYHPSGGMDQFGSLSMLFAIFFAELLYALAVWAIYEPFPVLIGVGVFVGLGILQFLVSWAWNMLVASVRKCFSDNKQ